MSRSDANVGTTARWNIKQYLINIYFNSKTKIVKDCRLLGFYEIKIIYIVYCYVDVNIIYAVKHNGYSFTRCSGLRKLSTLKVNLGQYLAINPLNKTRAW